MPKTVDERDLLAYADGRLEHDPARRDLVEAYLDDHPDDAERVAAYRAQAEALRRRYGSVVFEPVPERLTAVLDPPRAAPRHLRRAAAAALLAAAMGSGWLAAQWQDDPAQPLVGFVEDTRHAYRAAARGAPPASGPVSWRHVRLPVPDLAALGYQLAERSVVTGARGGEMVRLTYAAEGGRRFALFLRPRWGGEASDIHLAREGGVSFATWLDGPLATAVASEMSPEETLAVARAVQRVLAKQARPAAPVPAVEAPRTAGAPVPLPSTGAPAEVAPAVADGVVPN